MTHQNFNNIFVTFTKNKRGIRLHEKFLISGYELKEFLEYALEKEEELKNI